MDPGNVNAARAAASAGLARRPNVAAGGGSFARSTQASAAAGGAPTATTGAAGVPPGADVSGARAGAVANPTRLGAAVDRTPADSASIDSAQADMNVEGLSDSIGAVVQSFASIGPDGVGTGIGPMGVRIGAAGTATGPWWRYGGYHAGIYYPGHWWRDNAWHNTPAAGTAAVEGSLAATSADGSLAGSGPVTVRYDGPGVTIRNSSDRTVTFMVDGNKELSLAAGQTTRLADYPDYRLSFNLGEQFGISTYTVFEGTYDIAPTQHGWEFYRQTGDPNAAPRAGRFEQLPSAPPAPLLAP
jgi:hypothetical protein